MLKRTVKTAVCGLLLSIFVLGGVQPVSAAGKPHMQSNGAAVYPESEVRGIEHLKRHVKRLIGNHFSLIVVIRIGYVLYRYCTEPKFDLVQAAGELPPELKTVFWNGYLNSGQTAIRLLHPFHLLLMWSHLIQRKNDSCSLKSRARPYGRKSKR